MELAPKRLELLHELMPTRSVIALLLINPARSRYCARPTRVQELPAAHTLGLELHVLKASSERDFDGVSQT